MSTILDTLKKIKAAFEEMPPIAPEQNFSEYTLEDGTVISVSELAAGGTVMIGDQPAPVGEHKLSDGTVIVVGDGGVISEVKPAEAPAEDMKQDYSAEFAKINEQFAAYDARLAKADETIQQFDQALKTQSNTVAELIKLVEEMASIPTADPQAPPQQKFAKSQPVDRLQKFKGIAKAINTLSN